MVPGFVSDGIPRRKSTSPFFHEVQSQEVSPDERRLRQAQCYKRQQHHGEVGASRLSPCAHSRSLRSPGRLARVTLKTRAVGRLRVVDDGDNRHHAIAGGDMNDYETSLK